MNAMAGKVEPTVGLSRLGPGAVEALLGADEARHLAAKGLGGANGFKGARYEHLFGAHRIARLARKFMADGTDARVEWQSDGFVDDFVVRRDAARSFKGYQAKNAKVVSWEAGKRAIALDFTSQRQVCAAEGYSDVRLRLVCSDPEVVTSLEQDVPARIRAYSKAVYFPYSASALLPVLNDHPWMRDDFAFLSKYEAPLTIQVSEVAGVLMGAWDVLSPTALVSDVLNKARAMSPTLVRALATDDQALACVNPQFASLMASWPGFSYRIVRGFLTWSAFGGSTSGVLSMDCLDPKFQGWQEHLLGLSPSSFEHVEGAFI